MNIGKAIKGLRKEKGIAQNDFAKGCGISQTSISLIENGAKKPSAQTLNRIGEH